METTNVPPKPTDGNMYKIKAYYEEHKGAILNDIDTIGEKKMQKRWNISQATWNGLKKRWRPEIYGSAGVKHREPKTPKVEVKKERPLTADYFAGYRQAVLDGAPKVTYKTP